MSFRFPLTLGIMMEDDMGFFQPLNDKRKIASMGFRSIGHGVFVRGEMKAFLQEKKGRWDHAVVPKEIGFFKSIPEAQKLALVGKRVDQIIEGHPDICDNLKPCIVKKVWQVGDMDEDFIVLNLWSDE